MKSSWPVRWLSCACLLALFVGCSVENAGKSDTAGGDAGGNGTGRLAGTITIDGSSTVYPISQAVAEEFQKEHGDVKVVVGTSGTGGGFKKFALGETDVNDASRPVKDSEVETCQKNAVEFVELKIAMDGLSVVVNPDNDWCDSIGIEQLRAIWSPDSKVRTWSDVDPGWPNEPIKLYGPDTDSGTFDYFTEVVCGEEGRSRADYTPSTDDNFLVRGISGDKYSLGYFGYAYYIENKGQLKVLGVIPEGSSEAVVPSPETIETGTYTPLSRPLFLYVNTASLKRPHVHEFLRYYLREGQDLVGEVGYVRLSAEAIEAARKQVAAATE